MGLFHIVALFCKIYLVREGLLRKGKSMRVIIILAISALSSSLYVKSGMILIKSKFTVEKKLSVFDIFQVQRILLVDYGFGDSFYILIESIQNQCSKRTNNSF
jgi:hypothetical protein